MQTSQLRRSSAPTGSINVNMNIIGSVNRVAMLDSVPVAVKLVEDCAAGDQHHENHDRTEYPYLSDNGTLDNHSHTHNNTHSHSSAHHHDIHADNHENHNQKNQPYANLLSSLPIDLVQHDTTHANPHPNFHTHTPTHTHSVPKLPYNIDLYQSITTSSKLQKQWKLNVYSSSSSQHRHMHRGTVNKSSGSGSASVSNYHILIPYTEINSTQAYEYTLSLTNSALDNLSDSDTDSKERHKEKHARSTSIYRILSYTLISSNTDTHQCEAIIHDTMHPNTNGVISYGQAYDIPITINVNRWMPLMKCHLYITYTTNNHQHQHRGSIQYMSIPIHIYADFPLHQQLYSHRYIHISASHIHKGIHSYTHTSTQENRYDIEICNPTGINYVYRIVDEGDNRLSSSGNDIQVYTSTLAPSEADRDSELRKYRSGDTHMFPAFTTTRFTLLYTPTRFVTVTYQFRVECSLYMYQPVILSVSGSVSTNANDNHSSNADMTNTAATAITTSNSKDKKIVKPSKQSKQKNNGVKKQSLNSQIGTDSTIPLISSMHTINQILTAKSLPSSHPQHIHRDRASEKKRKEYMKKRVDDIYTKNQLSGNMRLTHDIHFYQCHDDAGDDDDITRLLYEKQLFELEKREKSLQYNPMKIQIGFENTTCMTIAEREDIEKQWYREYCRNIVREQELLDMKREGVEYDKDGYIIHHAIQAGVDIHSKCDGDGTTTHSLLQPSYDVHLNNTYDKKLRSYRRFREAVSHVVRQVRKDKGRGGGKDSAAR